MESGAAHGRSVAEREEPASAAPSAREATQRSAPMDLRLELIDGRPPLRLGLASASALMHAGLLVAIVVVPILSGSDLPPPASSVQVFFAEPLLIAPPPPPPPPAAGLVPKRPGPTPAPVLTAPVETPDTIVPQEVLEPSAPGGEPAGVEGGVPGGVVGAIVGGLPKETAPPPPVRVHVGHGVREPTKLKNVEPVYPPIALHARVQGDVVLELELSPQGRVSEARVLSGPLLLSDAAVAAVRQWVYTPTLYDGVPVEVIMTVTVRFRLS